ncbi:protein CNPPD1-like [Uloborus diversus]|uniref:protein CNPPD1-like n=1 Tax=Uloborus diversus TaxID=327109 RepID=UPI002409EDB9|nr:protein CNPPD1-like [Uloborus diversus]
MSSDCYAALSCVRDLISNNCVCREGKYVTEDSLIEDGDSPEDQMYDLLDEDALEEVFADHVLMSERLQKTLYAGKLDDDFPDHPPIALTGLALELFSKAAPNYGIDILDMDYVSSISESAKISPYAMIVAMIYLERLQLKNSEYLETVSPSGLFVVTMLVASKFLFENEEDIVTNQLWAEYLNFEVKELNNLERDFLAAIDWKIFVEPSDYLQQLSEVEKIIALRQSSVRGWLSYSDMCVMMQDAVLKALLSSCLKRIAKAALLWTLGYATTAFALYGSAILLQRCAKSDKPSEITISKENLTSLTLPITNTNESCDINNQVHISDQLSVASLPNLSICAHQDSKSKVHLHKESLACRSFSKSKVTVSISWSSNQEFRIGALGNFDPCFIKFSTKEFLVNHTFSNINWLGIKRSVSVI